MFNVTSQSVNKTKRAEITAKTNNIIVINHHQLVVSKRTTKWSTRNNSTCCPMFQKNLLKSLSCDNLSKDSNQSTSSYRSITQPMG